jgi:short-subunit dehydrogenase
VDDLAGGTALVTGATGGIGAHIARALASAGMNVVLSGRREDRLTALTQELRSAGANAEAVATDLSALEHAESLIERASALLGPLDVLVNNAGVEYAAAFTELSHEELTSMVDVNLTAPLLLTRAALPRMLERGRGHVVFIASVAAKLGPAYQAPYAATKAGLVGLTQALRAEYRETPVGFSVVCPGFVAGDGMYQRMVEEGFASNRLMGSTTLDRVADGVVKAIRQDRPEVVESGAPIKPLLALNQMAPRLGERMADWSGATELFRRVAASRGRAG